MNETESLPRRRVVQAHLNGGLQQLNGLFFVARTLCSHCMRYACISVPRVGNMGLLKQLERNGKIAQTVLEGALQDVCSGVVRVRLYTASEALEDDGKREAVLLKDA